MEILKKPYPCAAVIPEGTWRSEKEKKKKAMMSFNRSRIWKKTAAAYSNRILKFILKKIK